jgi:GntR family transcriptional regulator/MocR family aminotransferase
MSKRPKAPAPLAPSLIWRRDGFDLGLQRQIREQLIDGIVRGDLAPGSKLPSSRELARQLSVARNTVVLACQQLVADGHLVARERSGLYVSDDAIKNPALSERVMRRADGDVSSLLWNERIKAPVSTTENYRSPPGLAEISLSVC